MVFFLYEISIWYRLRDTLHLRFRLVTWTFRATKGQIFQLCWKAKRQLYNGVLLKRTLYFIPFARYSASKISVSDLDLSGSPKVKYFYFLGKPICNFIVVLCWEELSISYLLQDVPLLRFQLVTSTFQGHQRPNISALLESQGATL